MARRIASIAAAIGDDEDQAPETTTPAPEPARAAAESPRKRGGARKAQPAKKAAQVPTKARAVETQDAKRVSLYLDPADYRELALAKIDDGADLNSRIRAMIAVWRENARFRSQVDKIAQSAPRGGR